MTTSAPAPAAGGLRWIVSDAATVTKRYAIGMTRTPDVVFFSTVQPIMFVLLFVFVFGGSIETPGGGSYANYLMPGILVQTVAMATAVTGSAIALDVQRGIVDRFRALPMARSALLIGRSFADLVLNALSLLLVTVCGLLVGWRPSGSVAGILAGIGLVLLFGYAMTWLALFIGLSVPTPEAAAQACMLPILPAVFLSNLFVATENLPGWLQGPAAWNPVSAIITTVRGLMGNSTTSGSGGLPGRYPALVACFWILLIITVLVPLAVRRYRRITR
ncbi:ABC transporter permease [Salinispora vitiensis]|uniref:ABC transporter permease n=1 Tax=Salinispora vitiensis TaxID=999544 RepID=UPI000371E8CA|nr:ABC transporter permease [Salinispora vitiensis]